MSPKGAGFALVTLVVGALLAVIASGMTWEPLPPFAYDADRPVGWPHDIRHAVYAEGRLWILTQGGELWSVAEAEREPRREAPGGHVFGLCVRSGAPAVLTAPRQNAETWSFQIQNPGGWSPLATIRGENDRPLALFCDGDLRVLTNRRLVDLSEGEPRSRQLTARLPVDFESVSLAMPDQILFVFNHGEIGSALYGIAPRTGAVRQIYKHPADDPCGGPLGKYCDAITGLTPLPWKPGCAAAAVRANHIGMHGRLIEICGSDVRRLYLGPCPYPEGIDQDLIGDEPFCTELFFGVISKERTVLALGSEGLGEHGQQGLVRSPAPLPTRRYGRFRIAFGPDFILVGDGPDRKEPLEMFGLMIVPRSPQPQSG